MLRRLTHWLAWFLLQVLPMTALSARAAANGNYDRIGLYADRSAAVNVLIDRYRPYYPPSVGGDSLWAVRASGDTMCVFQSFADSGIVLRATDSAPSYVEYSMSPHRTIANLGVMACGREVHADAAGHDAMRITVFYENGDSSAAVLAVGKQLRDTYYGWDFCYGTQLFFHNTAPTDPLSAQLWADSGSRWANFLDAQEVILPFAKRALMATRVRISSVPLGRPCAGGTLWSSVYLAGLTTWTEPPHVLLVHGICGDASNWRFRDSCG